MKSVEISALTRRTVSYQSAGLTFGAYCYGTRRGGIPASGRQYGGFCSAGVLDPIVGKRSPGPATSSPEWRETAKYRRVECVCRQHRRAARPGGRLAPAPRTIALIQRLEQSGRALFARQTERSGRKCRGSGVQRKGESRTCPTRPFKIETLRSSTLQSCMEGQ